VSPRIRAYEQVCPIAAALDVLGNRWTLLIVRDLVLGPRRFTDLERGLPGIAPDVLIARLRGLQSSGLVDLIDLPPPASHRAYALTADGQAVVPSLLALGRWGWSRMPAPQSPEDLFVGRLLVACLIDPTLEAVPEGGIWELWVDRQPATVTVAEGRLHIAWGTVANPDARVHMGVTDLWRAMRGDLDLDHAIAQHDIEVDGDPDQAQRLIKLLHVRIFLD